MSRMGPCMCGATDCPSCGPAQGYTVVRRWIRGRWRHVNPEDGEEEEEDVPDEPERNEINDERNYL
jgi:hypothetical protein